MKVIKRCAVLIMVLMLALCEMGAFALTTAEKAEKYAATFVELEMWLENPERTPEELDLIILSFQEMNGYEHSKELRYYALVLQKS